MCPRTRPAGSAPLTPSRDLAESTSNPSCASSSTQRLEGGADLRGEELRLLPRGEVPALGRLVVVDEVVVRVLHPVSRSLEELVREHRETGRQPHVRGRVLERSTGRLVGLPVEPRGGCPAA